MKLRGISADVAATRCTCTACPPCRQVSGAQRDARARGLPHVCAILQVGQLADQRPAPSGWSPIAAATNGPESHHCWQPATFIGEPVTPIRTSQPNGRVERAERAPQEISRTLLVPVGASTANRPQHRMLPRLVPQADNTSRRQRPALSLQTILKLSLPSLNLLWWRMELHRLVHLLGADCGNCAEIKACPRGIAGWSRRTRLQRLPDLIEFVGDAPEGLAYRAWSTGAQ